MPLVPGNASTRDVHAAAYVCDFDIAQTKFTDEVRRSTDSHAFKNALTKTQHKKVKQAHQDELVGMLRDLSIA